MDSEVDAFGEALGIWKITVGGASLEVRPMIGDGRKMRDIMMDGKHRKDRSLMFEAFEEFIIKIILRDYPGKDDRTKEYVDLNAMELFKETQIAFRITTREKMKEAEAETKEEIKKLVGSI